jgi:hypothetical protein
MITPDFVLGGRAVFTVDTDSDYYTLRIAKTRFGSAKEPFYFLFQLVDPASRRGGRYIGSVDPDSGHIQLTTKSWLMSDSPEIIDLQLAFDAIWGDVPLPDGWEIRHVGRCGVCDRRLTTPESLERGIGPECYGQRNMRGIKRTSHRRLPRRAA